MLLHALMIRAVEQMATEYLALLDHTAHQVWNDKSSLLCYISHGFLICTCQQHGLALIVSATTFTSLTGYILSPFTISLVPYPPCLVSQVLLVILG